MKDALHAPVEGVLLACEMDVNGLLSAMLLTHLAACPAFMGNVIPGLDDRLDSHYVLLCGDVNAALSHQEARKVVT